MRCWFEHAYASTSVHGTASCLRSKRGVGDQRGRLIGRTKAGMNTKLHDVTDAHGSLIRSLMTASHVSDYAGAAVLPGNLAKPEQLLADRGYDTDWCRNALKAREMKPCVPAQTARGKRGKRSSECRNRIEIGSGG